MKLRKLHQIASNCPELPQIADEDFVLFFKQQEPRGGDRPVGLTPERRPPVKSMPRKRYRKMSDLLRSKARKGRVRHGTAGCSAMVREKEHQPPSLPTEPPSKCSDRQSYGARNTENSRRGGPYESLPKKNLSVAHNRGEWRILTWLRSPASKPVAPSRCAQARSGEINKIEKQRIAALRRQGRRAGPAQNNL